MELTEATDSGLWEEGMVKERTMEWGRDPRRSSAAGWHRREKENHKEFSLKATDCFEVTCVYFLFTALEEGQGNCEVNNSIMLII